MRRFKKTIFLSLILLTCFLLSDCAHRPISRAKGIVYEKSRGLELNVYAPKNRKNKKEVLIFIHGGNWRSGKKSLYSFFGKGFARKGVVTVVIDYRLSKETNYAGMGADAAAAVKWVKENIEIYGGDPSKIFISGHSAGGHLSALVASDPKYFKEAGIADPIKGVILIDAFGLDMYAYLSNSTALADSIYYETFTTDRETWKKGSPSFYLRNGLPPFIMFVGGKTFPAIKRDSEGFLTALKAEKIPVTFVAVKGKRHIPMIGRFYNPRSKGYRDILEFIRK